MANMWTPVNPSAFHRVNADWGRMSQLARRRAQLPQNTGKGFIASVPGVYAYESNNHMFCAFKLNPDMRAYLKAYGVTLVTSKHAAWVVFDWRGFAPTLDCAVFPTLASAQAWAYLKSGR